MFKVTRKKLTLSAAVIVGFLLLSVLSPVVRPLTITILKAPLGLLRLVSREIGGMIFYHRNLVNNEKLRNRVDFLTHKINELSETYLENARLRQLLALKEKAPYRVISARVIARSPDSWSSVIIIDKGSRNGIRRGLVAVNFLGLVGRVVETDEATSKVMLISDPNLSVSALIQRSRQEGLVSGTLGTSLIMRYLPKDSDIKLYDTVITSGLTEIFPKGLLIGKVIDIGEEFSGLSRYAAIRPAANLSNLEEVLIIIP